MKKYADFNIDLDGRTGAEVSTTCPQCSAQRKNKKAKCLSVNTEKGVWICFHCDWRGTLKVGEEFPGKKIYRRPTWNPKPVTSPLLDWFQSRGISQATVEREGIVMTDHYLSQLEDTVACIAFPYVKNGEVVNLKYRAVSEKAFQQVSGAEKVLYRQDAIQRDCVVIVEGEVDALSVVEAGFLSVVSVPDGAPAANTKNYSTKFTYLDQNPDPFEGVEKIILAVDADEPGQCLQRELGRRLGTDRCWSVQWPDGCKDANEVLMNHGPVILKQCLENATPYPLDGVVTVSAAASEVLALYENGASGGLSAGWPSVDEYYTVKPGEMTIVTGIPAHGKSQFLDALAVNLARNHGWTFGICSPENLPVQRHIAKLTELHTGFPFREGPSMRLQKDDLVPALAWLDKHFVFLGTDDMMTIPVILDTAKTLVARHGIQGLILDPWNEFDHIRPSGQSETEHISTALGQIRRFARTHDVHVWVVAHPQKLYRRDDGSYPVPTPYDISGSAHWRNKADNCLTVWRDVEDPDSPVKLYIQKIRFREIGKVGMVDLYFNKINGRYEEKPLNQKLHWTEKERVYSDVD